MNIKMNKEDIIDANISLIDSFVYEANSTTEKEKKIKNLLMAQKTIEKTLRLMDFYSL